MHISRVLTPPVGVLLLTVSPLLTSPALAAEPGAGTVDQRTDFAWHGATYDAAATTALPCPSAAQDPDDLVCDHVTVTVGGDGTDPLVVSIQSPVESADFDLYVHDAHGALVGSSANAASDESVTVPAASGTYEVRVQPWLVTEPSSYTGSATVGAPEPGGRAGGSDRPPRPKKYDAPDFSDKLWGLDEIGARLANEISTGEDAVVAVIDTGVDVHHPEFEGRFTAPMSWVCPDGAPVPCGGYENVDDGHGHGTHVAGTVAAADDGKGVTGVAPDATIMPVRVGDDEGSIVGDLAAATRYATEQGADVITVSIGFIVGSGPVISNPVAPLDGGWAEAVQEAADAGILVTLAAGNDGAPYCGQGEFWQDAALCVGAYGTGSDPAVYSDWGHELDVSAPGGGLLSCDGGIWSTVPLDLAEVDSCTGTPGYGVKAGTSMATPHAAGVGAMLADLGVGGLDARHRIIDTARGAGIPTAPAGVTGPRLDAAAAVQP
ncbi:S8 family serine peptidase [Blastococcus capsensis]|uniref:S8 family serine peptidase n=1 Tax=Blastococcus capsensis TaxID=1564163 RepID=UPI0025414CD9|nr:S8 family serine peptidase [Blastococcus capsensis]MDK3256974.1 S8 family serine peptidase [Blastococcus capsensis]